MSVDPDTGVGQFLPSRWPVLQVLAAQWSSATAFPRNYSVIPPSACAVSGGFSDNSYPSDPAAAGADAYNILIAPGYVPGLWQAGRNSTAVQMSFFNGWPHTSLTGTALAGATTISVDDVTGLTGLTPTIYDEPNDEQINVLSVAAVTSVTTPAPSSVVVQTGPGTLTLASPLLDNHPVGTMVSTMPYSIQQAMIYLSVAQALVRGATAITAQALPGSLTVQGRTDNTWYVNEAKSLLAPYARII